LKPVDAYILQQPDVQRQILMHVIAVISKKLPTAELLFKYGVPYFYFRKKQFCYLAVNVKKGFVDVGFAKGYQLKANQNVLVGENRNTVKSLRYFSIETINQTILEAVIDEASLLFP